MSFLNQITKGLKNHLINIPGWRTDRKIVVFESDDWGSIRMPSKLAFNSLLNQGIRVDKSYYDSLDTLEAEEDLTALFDILSNYKAKFTFNTVLGNPDYRKIKQSEFLDYYLEPIEVGYQRLFGKDLLKHWTGAIKEGIMKPQFHAREHLNVPLWLRDLKAGNAETLIAFENEFYGLKTHTSSHLQGSYLYAHWPAISLDIEAIRRSVEEGLEMFKEYFGFSADTFVACNYVWHDSLNTSLLRKGITGIQTQPGRKNPSVDLSNTKIVRSYFGQRNELGQTYSIRNCQFEPYLNQELAWDDLVLDQISTAFKWKKPAVVSTHRINYVSGMSVENRDRSLVKLESLVKRIRQKWSDVEFFTSDELNQLLK